MGSREAVRFVVRATLGAVALLVVYLAAANAMLRTRFTKDAIGKNPGALRVDYTDAYSLFPGYAHVNGLRIRGRDGAVEWILAIDRCSFRISFAELVRKHFRAAHVRAEGLSLRLRGRKDAMGHEQMAATAPIPGFLDPPLTDSGPPEAPLTDANYRLWSVRLDDVDVQHVREVWIDTARFTGDAEVRSRSWLFRPVRLLSIGPAVLDAHPVTVSRGASDEAWVEGVRGRLAVTCWPTDLQRREGATFPDWFSIDGDLAGRVAIGSVTNRVVPGVKAHNATPTFRAFVDVDRGKLGPGTDVDVSRFYARVAAGPVVVDASMAGRARVGEDGVGAATVDVRGLDLRHQGTLRATAPHAAAILRTRALDLAHPLARPARPAGGEADAGDRGAGILSLDVPAIDVPSLPSVARLAPLGPVSVDGGSATARAHMDVPLGARAAGGSAQLVTRGLQARVGARELRGELRADVRARQRGSRTDLSGSSIGFVGEGGAGVDDWWARAELSDAVLQSGPAPRLRARVLGLATDATPLTAAIARDKGLPRFALDAVSTRSLEVSGEIAVAPAVVEASAVKVHGSGLDAELEYASLHGSAEWAMALDAGPAKAGIHVAGGRTDVRVVDVRPWFAEKVASLRAAETHVDR